MWPLYLFVVWAGEIPLISGVRKLVHFLFQLNYRQLVLSNPLAQTDCFVHAVNG